MRETLDRRRTDDVNVRAALQMREYEAIVERIAGDRPGRLLDWGCGHGQVSHLLKQAGVDVTPLEYRDGVDDGWHPLERFPDLQAYLTSEPVKLPFDDASFDSVLSCGVLEHVQYPEESLDELRRVLVPGGRLYVYKLPNRFSYLEKIAKAIGIYYHGRAPFDRIYDKRSALALIERHGYRVDELRRMNMLPLTMSTGRTARALAGPLFTINRVFSRVPLLNLVATNVELVARARD